MSNNGHHLWCAVIDQAITDATQPLSRKVSTRMEQIRAREWLTLANRDFDDVCGLAGIEAERVRAVATVRIEHARKHDPEIIPPKPKGRPPHRGVGSNFQEKLPDRSTPITRDCV
jgi:hypothetical protein